MPESRKPKRIELRLPRPSKSRAPRATYEYFRWGRTWVEVRIPKKLNSEAIWPIGETA
ncbi:hypothetical protein D3C86_1530720 [compost metagenome]